MKTVLLAIFLAAAARLSAQDGAQGTALQKDTAPNSPAAAGAATDAAKFPKADVDFSSRLFTANARNAGGAPASNGEPFALPRLINQAGAAGSAGLALQAEFQYDPVFHAAAEAKSGENEGAPLTLEPFHVSESRERAAAEAIDLKTWQEAAKEFSLRSGGTEWAGTFDGYPVEVGLSGHNDLLPTPARETSPAWDLVTFRF